MAPRSRKSKAGSSINLDLISTLPLNIREKILTYLPIKEAGRTSVLSSAWRQTWTSIPEIVIIGIDYLRCSEFLIKLVDALVLLHNGPIHKFSLQALAQSPDAFARWIRHLSRNGIKELKLDLRFHSMTRNAIPSSFFSCDTLTSVSLSNCSLKLPDGFEGFEFLHTFDIDSVDISGDCIKKLVSCCPALENLTLHCFDNCTVLDIQAPNLKHLRIDGEVKSLKLIAPMLLSLRVDLIDFRVKDQSSKTNLKQVLGCVPNLEVLAMGYYFVEFLVKGHVGKLPMTFQNIKKLSLDLAMNDDEHVAFLFSLLHNTPNLEVLDIGMYFDWNQRPEPPMPNFWKSVDANGFSFKHLRIVNIKWFEDLQNGVSFVGLLLGSAPELQEININNNGYFGNDGDDGFEDLQKVTICLKQLLSFRRASVKAQVVFKSLSQC